MLTSLYTKFICSELFFDMLYFVLLLATLNCIICPIGGALTLGGASCAVKSVPQEMLSQKLRRRQNCNINAKFCLLFA